MKQELFHLFVFLGIFLLLTGASHLLHQVAKFSTETSRKFLHVSGGLLALCLPSFFNSHWIVLAMCVLAFLLLFITYIKKWLPAVHQTSRKSFGSILFPIPVYICFLVALGKQDLILFYIPVSFLAVSDTIAEWSGKRWGNYSMTLMKGQKSMAGSIGFAISAGIMAISFCMYFEMNTSQIILTACTVTIVATIAEMVSTYGFDNLTVPLSALASLCLMRLVLAR